MPRKKKTEELITLTENEPNIVEKEVLDSEKPVKKTRKPRTKKIQESVSDETPVKKTRKPRVKKTEVKEETPVVESVPFVTAGDRECYIYFDTEFTGLKKDTTLISIGLADAAGDTFYAEFTDYNQDDVTPWIQENVINNLLHPTNVLKGKHWGMTGTKHEVKEALMKWLEMYNKFNHNVQFVSDVCHYDFVLLVDLLLDDPKLTAIDLPPYISECCVDLNQDIATSLYRQKPEDMSYEKFNHNYVPAMTAFNISRGEAVSGIKEFQYEGNEHNSLYDALVIRAIHQNLWNIEK